MAAKRVRSARPRPASRGFRVLVANDGSEQGRAALAAATAFCWPAGARLHGVVVRDLRSIAPLPPSVVSAVDSATIELREATERALRRADPRAQVSRVDGAPAPAILAEARRIGARAIVVGSRGHGLFGRLLLGSTSRSIAREAGCAVLIVKGKLAAPHRILFASDGSETAGRAEALVAALSPPRGGRVTLLSVLDPIRTPSVGPLPASVRGALRAEAEELAKEGEAKARAALAAGARRLERAGWKTRVDVRRGLPLPTILGAMEDEPTNLLVLGARGTTGLRRVVLGSVAQGALDDAPVSILLVR